MLIQFILSVIEDFILSVFISKMSEIKNEFLFVFFNTIICVVLTNLFNYYAFLTDFLPIFIFLSIILLLKIFREKITLNTVVFSLVGLAMIILTDLIALLLYGFISDMTIKELIATPKYIEIASFLAKALYLIFCIICIYSKKYLKNILSYKKWGILFPIWFLIFSSIYILGNAIVSNTLSNNYVYYLIVSQVLLSVFIIILCYLIQKESINNKQIELNAQKEKYIRENKRMILKLHDEITTIDHNNMYTLLQIKNYLINQNFDKVFQIIDDKIFCLKKYKNIIYTGNPYFDQVLNREINKFFLSNKDIKTICSVTNSNFEVEKKEMDFIVDILKYLFSISESEQPFTMEINDRLNYLNMSSIFYHNDQLSLMKIRELIKTYSLDNVRYQFSTEEEITFFKLIMEIK